VPAHHPTVLLKVNIQSYLNRISSSQRLERERSRKLELTWLTWRLAEDFKTIADSRRDTGNAIRNACRQFVVLCRQLNLLSQSQMAINGRKFTAVNNCDRNFTQGKLRAGMEQIEKSIKRYLAAMDPPTGRNPMSPKPKSPASRTKSRNSASRCR